MKTKIFNFKARWLLVPLVLMTLGAGNAWGAAGDEIKATGSITSGKSYYIKGVRTNGTVEYLNFTDSKGNSVAGTGVSSTSSAQALTFTCESSNWYITTASGLYLTPASSNGKLILTDTKTSVTLGNGTNVITIKGTSYYLQKNKTAANFGGYNNTQNNVTLIEAAASCTPLTMSTVTATPGNAQIALSWPSVTNANSYTVSCKVKSSGVAAGTAGSVTGTSTKSCTITGLTNGVEYTWSVEPVGSGTYCSSNTPATGDATPNVSRTITYYDKDGQHTTSLVEDTNIATALNALYGVGGPTSCDTEDYEYFVGWKDGNISGTASSVTLLSTEVVNATTAAKTYYAVWSDKDPSSGSWTQVTSVAVGDKVVIAQIDDGTKEMDAFNASATTANNYGTGATFSTNPAGTMIWTVEAGNSEGSFAFKNSNNYYLNLPSDNNYLNGSTTKNNYSSWTIQTSSSRAAVTNVQYTTRKLMWNKANTRFSTYAGKSHGYNSGQYYYYVIFYKQAAVSANYITTCCTQLGTINGSINLSTAGLTMTASGWSDISHASNYTVKLYKWNGSAWALANNNSTTGGASGAQATRTVVPTNNKSVTWSNLEYGAKYKVTVQAIGNGSNYCDGAETAVTKINDGGDGVTLNNNEIPFNYSIYIDDATNANYAHNIISAGEISSTTATKSLTLLANKDYYQFKVVFGAWTDSGTPKGLIWWGNNGKMVSDNCTNWDFASSGVGNCKLQTTLAGSYIFTINFASAPCVSLTYPSPDQAAGNIVYWDASIHGNDWTKLIFRVGTSSNANAGSDCKIAGQLVTGTDQFYKVTTASFNGMDVWAIANNSGWTGSNANGVYKTKTGDVYAVTKSSAYQDYVVDATGVTLIPDASGSTGSQSHDNNCTFYPVTKTDGMLTHTATIGSHTNGTINIAYTDVSGTSQPTNTSTVAGLAHRTKITASATPDAGYELTEFTVTPDGESAKNLTSGVTDNHILAKDATFAATFTAKEYTVTLDRNGATSGSESVTMTYNSASHTAITAPSKNGYTFDGWYDSETDNNGSGNLVMNASGVLQDNVSGYTGAGGIWTRDDNSTTLYAKWTPTPYTITYNLDGGDVATPNPTSYTIEDAAITLNNPTKTGCDFAGWTGTDLEGATTTVTIAAGSTGDRSYTATWTAKTDTYKTALHTSASGWTAYASGYTATTSGAGYTIPNPGSVTKGATSSCEDTHYHFAGWVSDANKEAGTIEGNVIPASGTTDATGTTYWAVWEKEAAGGGDASYVLVESAPDSWAGDYLIVYNNTYALNTHYDNRNTNSYATYSDISSYYTGASKSIASNATTDALAYTIAETTYGHSISHKEEINSVATDVYLGCNSTNNKGLRWDQPFTASTDEWTLGVGGITSVNQTGRGIRWNNNSGQERFATYATDGQQAIQLFKYDPGVSYTDPIAACAAVTCGTPTGMSSGTPGSFGTTISWTAPGVGTPSKYQYCVWADGESAPTSDFDETNTTSASISGLKSNTTYHWKVRSYCGVDDESTWCADQTFSTTAVALTFSVPLGASAVAGQNSNVALPDAEVPSTCSNCWEFIGWTTSSSVDASSAPATLFAAGDYAHVGTGETTLYAVYMKDEFNLVTAVSEFVAGGSYIFSFTPDVAVPEDAEFALKSVLSGTDGTSTDIQNLLHDPITFINPPSNLIWDLSGSAGAWNLHNAANNLYINLSNSSGNILTEGADALTIGASVAFEKSFYVQHTGTAANNLVCTNTGAWVIDDKVDEKDVDNEGAGMNFVYKRISLAYATSPSCPTYTVRWYKENMTTPVATETVTACDGEISTMPNSSAYAIDCADKFMGWSETNIGSTGTTAPPDLFNTLAEAPVINGDKYFYAVFASADDESSSYVDDVLDQSLTEVNGTSYVEVSDLTDASGAVYAGKCAGDHSSIQLNATSPNAIVTTTSGGLARKVTVVWESHTSNGRTLDIYGKNTAYSSGADLWTSDKGTKIGSIVCGTSTELTISDDYAFIGFRSNSNAMYLTSVTIKWEQPGYKDYVTTCCDKTVTLSSNVTGEGAVSFSAAALATCGAGSATMTITPTAGYKLTAFNTEGTTATPNSMAPAGGVTVPSESTQTITLNYDANATGAYVANPTFEAILVSSLTLHAQKLDDEDNVIFDQTSNAVAMSMYPTEGKTASPADILGHKASISFGAVLPANALNTGYTWSATVNGEPVAFTSNTLNANSVIEFNKNTGKLVAKAAGTAVITITANDGSGVTASVTITVANVALTSVSTTPVSLTVYSGQLLPVVVNYDPVNVTTKGYSYSGDDNVTICNRGKDGFNVEGHSVSVDTHNDLVITTTSDSRQTTLPITIKPLPKVHFLDIVHGEISADVAATIDLENQGTVIFDKRTPTHADISPAPSTPNACENTHLHLIGWIDSEWSGVANYMNNTAAKPTTEAIIGATGYFLAPNAEIDTDALKNKTFYAVWAIEVE